MLLKAIKLRNIRSYLDEKIEFPQGTVMLSGDIGSGKSTILLAIEFALFGLLRGELSGSTLLRHGKNEGSVELEFELDGKTYTIKRTLKRSKNAVEQETGYLLIDGRKKEATATELKTQILELLGYPLELVTKSKSLVYRYTVYTPQEEMKRILVEDKESRLAILRKVFGIDKYERIKANTSAYVRLLRERKKGFEGMLADFEEKKKLLEEKMSAVEQVKGQLAQLLPKLEAARKAVLAAKERLAKVETARTKTEELKRQIAMAETEFKAKNQQLTRVESEEKLAQAQIENIENELGEQAADQEQLAAEIEKKNRTIVEKEGAIQNARSKIAELMALKRHAQELATKVSSLSTCPVCLQEVNQQHKQTIVAEQQEKISELEEHVARHAELAREIEKELATLKREVEALRVQEKQAAIQRVKLCQLNELAAKQKRILQEKETLRAEIEKLAARRKELLEELKSFEPLAETYKRAREEAEAALEQEKQLAVQHSALEEKHSQLSQQVLLLRAELERKAQAKAQLQQLQELHNWLTEYFAPLMDIIERHVMAVVQREFNALFQQWFNMLVEDEMMSARLDDSFTPIITQNGYETDVENLSGGEKTACALAYRLALNRVVNDLISGIKTKNLLILDEPTDGFSTEQLDKMRDVIKELNLKQMIIVSHEQKIESFVDSVIRVGKEGHISRIIT